ncbi:uncharacterized protein LOC128858283 [Anastrepha ludens]|uniref:uncharacterized protein LOC128858283 n=1 Tax=Anastrepha ludens TaxID=28586 RepID=UPI0023B074C5|nr:uncharacterized protein LOC128858283 [Anastrepha ludens]
MNDANLRPKCPFVEEETLQKPVVVMRLTRTSLNAETEMLSEEEADDDESEGSADATGFDHNGYTLVELSKTQVQQLFDSGKLQLVESEDGNTSMINMYKENAGDTDDLDDLDDADERSKKRPWRKIKRILRRQLVKKPKRYFKKIAHSIG